MARRGLSTLFLKRLHASDRFGILKIGQYLENTSPRRSYSMIIEKVDSLMDHSLQSADLTINDLTALPAANPEETVEAEEEHHIHLPGPSWWPLLLSVAILVAIAGLLFIPDNPWITIIAAPFVLVGILGWGLEDPMAPPKERYSRSQKAVGTQSRFQM